MYNFTLRQRVEQWRWQREMLDDWDDTDVKRARMHCLFSVKLQTAASTYPSVSSCTQVKEYDALSYETTLTTQASSTQHDYDSEWKRRWTRV